MISCLLFDCDGTLVDSERLCNVGLVKKFQAMGISLDPDELVVRFRGWKLAKILEALESEYSVTLPEDFVPSYRSIVSDLFEVELKPVSGVEHALENLPHPKAVVSSGPPAKIEQALRVCGLSKHFGEHIYSAYDIGIWKPDPGIYRHAAEGMGFADQVCAVIDDSPVGVEAGHAAGMKTFFYSHFEEPCELPGIVSFGSMYRLPELING